MCGSCARDLLSTCTCETAEEAREKIRDKLRPGACARDPILAEYATTFGAEALAVPPNPGALRAIWVVPVAGIGLAAFGLAAHDRDTGAVGPGGGPRAFKRLSGRHAAPSAGERDAVRCASRRGAARFRCLSRNAPWRTVARAPRAAAGDQPYRACRARRSDAERQLGVRSPSGHTASSRSGASAIVVGFVASVGFGAPRPRLPASSSGRSGCSGRASAR